MKTVMQVACGVIAMFALSFSTSAFGAQVGAQPADDKEEVAGQAVRRAEGEKLLGRMRDYARVAFAKTDVAPRNLVGEISESGCGVAKEKLTAKYNRVHDSIYKTKADKPALICEDTVKSDGFAIMLFAWSDSDSECKWYETLEALKEAHMDPKKGDTGEGDKPGEKVDEGVDAYALYKKEGRKWKHKSTVKIEGMDPLVSYMSYEITKVAEDHAMQKLTLLDKDGEPMMGMEPTETRIEFEVQDGAEPADAPKIETKEETVKVEAGEFLCIMVEMSGTKTWVSKKFPGLLVKMEADNVSMELVEWKE